MERRRDIPDNIGEEEVEGKSPILVRSDSPVKAVFRQEGSYDGTMATEEMRALLEHMSLVTANLGTPKVSSAKELSRWQFLEERDDTLRQFLVHLRSDSSQMLKDSKKYTWGHMERMQGLILASSLLYQSTVRERIAIARKNSFDDNYTTLAKLLEFDNVPELSIRVGSVSLLDFQSFSPKATPVAPYYRYLLEGRLMKEDAIQQAFEENQDYPKSIYPNLTKFAISVLPNRLHGIINLTPETFPTDNVEPILREGGKLAIRVLEGVQEIRKKVNLAVFDPESRDFPELSTLVAKYLESKDKDTRVLSLYLMNLDTRQRIVEAYRKSRKYEMEDNNGEFYMIFGDSIAEYIEEASPVLNILTNDDVASILDGDNIEHNEEKSEPSFEQLGKRVNDIFNKTSKKDFPIEPGDINWSQLYVPGEVKINFDSSRPRIFTMKIAFNNDLGESTEVECSINTVKNFMNWNHPEDPMLLPKNSDLMAFRRSLMLATQSILDNVYRQAQEEYQSRRASQTAPLPVETRRPKRERVQDPVYELRRTSRRQQQEQESTNILFDVLSSKEEIKNRVVLPSDEEFENMVRYLSHVDRDIVRKSIEEYNEKGTGAKFTRKRKVGTEGDIVYGLSIGCSVPKGARVLLRETESEVGTRNFEVKDIRYRKDIYPKNKL